MALSYKARRRWALFVLVIGLPVYIVLAVNIIDAFERPPLWLEVVIYASLGVLWALPLRSLFRGIGQAEPSAADPEAGR